jgi:hypothetical protein
VAVIRDMVAHMRSHPGVIYGITTDGSKGPVYRMKPGAVHIAYKSGAPVLVLKTWCKRYLRLPTWDGTLVPLPFNYIVHGYAGPIAPRADLPERERFAALCRDVERALCQLTAYVRRRAEGRPPPQEWIDLFPEEVRAEMARAEEPTLFVGDAWKRNGRDERS